VQRSITPVRLLRIGPSRAIRNDTYHGWQHWSMNKAEARELLASVLLPLRGEAYEQLVSRYLDQSETVTVVGPSGVEYQIELQAFWDGDKPGPLRVMGAVDDGGWRTFKPLTSGFIMASDGSFIDE
jgi:hypothetical protein